jgi:hypothetical protein
MVLSAAGIRLAGATNDVHIFDIRSGKWEKVTPIGEPPSPRAAHAAAAVGNMVVIQVRRMQMVVCDTCCLTAGCSLSPTIAAVASSAEYMLGCLEALTLTCIVRREASALLVWLQKTCTFWISRITSVPAGIGKQQSPAAQAVSQPVCWTSQGQAHAATSLTQTAAPPGAAASLGYSHAIVITPCSSTLQSASPTR